MKNKISVIIPTLNEEKTIGKVVKDFRRVLRGAEIIVYDGNSSDKTKEIAKKAGAKVHIQSGRGKGQATREALEKINSDLYVIVDGDDTYSSKDVRKLIEPVLKKEAEMTVGVRIKKEKSAMKGLHVFGNMVITKSINLFFGKGLKDVLSGYRVLSKKAAKDLLLTSKGFEIETEMTIKALISGLRVKEIPVEYKKRPDGSESKLGSFSDGYLIFYTILSLFRDYRPLAFFSMLSLIFGFAGLSFGVVVVTEWLETGIITRFPTAILSSLLILLSIQFFSVGLMSDSFNRKYESLQQAIRKRS